jgi:ADP-ribosyl-[dinitrogen reductase] hydrolase
MAARAVSDLTHYDPEAGDACVLWCLAIRHAVLTGDLDALGSGCSTSLQSDETFGPRG